MDLNGDMDDREDAIDDIDGLLYEQFRDVAQEENGVGEGPNEYAKKFYNLLEDVKQELYPGCKNFTKLSFTIRLYLLKCLYGWSNASFNALLVLCEKHNVQPETRLNRMTRNSDRCDPCEVGIGHSIGSAKVISLEYKLRSQAHRYILFNHDEVQEFIREHENVITNVKKRKKWSKAKSQGQDFVEWFKNRALMDDVPDHLKELSRGPNTIARCFSSYVINGYRFHTKQRDAKRKTQNSGVSVVSVTQSFASTKDENPTTKPIAYYGSIIEIIELDYYGSSKFVHQCFYIEDPFDANRKYVMKTIPRDFFNMKDDINSNAQELYQSESSDHAVNLAIVDSNYEVELVRDDMSMTFIENPLLKSNMVESEDELDFDATLSESMELVYLKMNRRIDIEPHQFQGKSSAELLKLYKVKVEGAKNMKKNKESTSKQEPRKNSTAGSVVQEARNTQIQHQKKDQRKQPLTTTSEIQEGAKNMKKNKELTSNQEPRKNSTVASVVQEARNTQIQHQKKDQSKQPLGTTSAVQEVRMQQEKLEVRSTLMQHGKQEQRKKLLAIGSVVQVGRSTQTHHKKQDQMRQSLATGSEVEVGGSTYIPSQKDLDNHAFLVQPESSKKIDDQNDRFCPNNLKRQLRNTIGDHGQGSTEEQPTSKKPKATSKCPAISLEKYINNHRDQLEEEELEDEESEENDIEQEVEGDINFENEEDEDTNDNTTEVLKSLFSSCRVQARRIKSLQLKLKCSLKLDRTKLQDLIENSGVPSTEAFKTVFGKEKPGRVRCYGRTTTPTLLKRNEEITEIEKRHANEVKHLIDKVHEIEAKHEEMEVKHSKEMAAMEQKFQLLLRTMLNQNDSRVDMESLAALLSPCDANSGLRSSTSTHAPNNPKESPILAWLTYSSTSLEEAMQGDMQIITSNIYTDLVGHAMSVTLQALNMHQTNICSGFEAISVVRGLEVHGFEASAPVRVFEDSYTVCGFVASRLVCVHASYVKDLSVCKQVKLLTCACLVTGGLLLLASVDGCAAIRVLKPLFMQLLMPVLCHDRISLAPHFDFALIACNELLEDANLEDTKERQEPTSLQMILHATSKIIGEEGRLKDNPAAKHQSNASLTCLVNTDSAISKEGWII
ncbi:hypothetical protein ZIOFF_035242 [Zingiber officinale]|uniref:Uncharacterized protein n=1 Tax=Zingiber officinale TaxID=94328 RepID=A0A8J5G916_ZINOF|nr:hypothetical protein ZIOFF_035242 [Zingiber officinale]